MKLKLLPSLLLLISLVTASNLSWGQAPISLGNAADFGVLAGANANTTTPAYSYGLYGGLVSTSPGFGGSTAGPASVSGIQLALSDLNTAKTQGYSLNGTTISAKLTGMQLSPGVYQVKGDALVGTEGVLTLKGNEESFFVFNVLGTMSFEEKSQVVLIGVRPEQVYWNVKGSIDFAPNADASGLFLAEGDIATKGWQFGKRQLLASNDVLLNNLGQSFGTSSFHSASALASVLVLGCTPTVPAVCDNQVINAGFED